MKLRDDRAPACSDCGGAATIAVSRSDPDGKPIFRCAGCWTRAEKQRAAEAQLAKGGPR